MRVFILTAARWRCEKRTISMVEIGFDHSPSLLSLIAGSAVAGLPVELVRISAAVCRLEPDLAGVTPGHVDPALPRAT